MIVLRDAVRKNLHTANVSESFALSQRLRSNIKILRIRETIRFTEKVRRLGGIRNLSIWETLTFVEKTHPRVKVYNVSESLHLREITQHMVIGDKLAMIETATYSLVKTISDNLVLTETLTFKANRTLPVSESLSLVEGLSFALFPAQGAVVSSQDSPTPTGQAIQEKAIGATNGINTIFTITSSIPTILNVYVNGELTTAYTRAGNQLTFTVAPAAGSNIFVNYFQ